MYELPINRKAAVTRISADPLCVRRVDAYNSIWLGLFGLLVGPLTVMNLSKASFEVWI